MPALPGKARGKLMVPLTVGRHLEAPERGASHLAPQEGPIMEQLLSVNQAAELLGTTVRFPRRLTSSLNVEFASSTSAPRSHPPVRTGGPDS